MFEDDRYYLNKDAAKGLLVGDMTLRNSRSTGTLSGVTTPPFIKRGRTVLYLGSTLNAWLGQFEARHHGNQKKGDVT
jgi:hypothetical protein